MTNILKWLYEIILECHAMTIVDTRLFNKDDFTKIVLKIIVL